MQLNIIDCPLSRKSIQEGCFIPVLEVVEIPIFDVAKFLLLFVQISIEQ